MRATSSLRSSQGFELRPVGATLAADDAVLAKRRLAATAHGWTQRVGGYAGVPHLIRELAVDPGATLAAAGLAADALSNAEARIPYVAFGRLLLVAAEHTGCAHVGLLAGRMLNLAHLGRMGAVVRSRPTVRDALRTFVAHQHLDSEGALAFLIEGGATTEFGHAIYHPYVDGTDQIYDCGLGAMMNYLRELCGVAWSPSEVLVPHARSADDRPYRALLRVAPRFNADVCAIRFPSRWMDQPLALDGAAESAPIAAALASDDTLDLIQHVFRALRRLLLEGRTSGDDVAKALGMNRRTLNRRLRARGITFQYVLHEMRYGLARQMLSTSEIGLDDVAANLGYAGTSPFARTFNRWAGTPPGRWRRFRLAHTAHSTRADI